MVFLSRGLFFDCLLLIFVSIDIVFLLPALSFWELEMALNTMSYCDIDFEGVGGFEDFIDIDFECVDGRVVVRVRLFNTVSLDDVIDIYRRIVNAFKNRYRVDGAGLESPDFIDLVIEFKDLRWMAWMR